MQRTTLLTLGLVAICASQAQLQFDRTSSLYEHMNEVNAQWHSQGLVPENASAEVEFTSEADRIATHLKLVRETLQARSLEGLSASQQAHRMELLEILDVYANAGIFPKNYVLPYRNPVFIDPHGIACAVGQLMIESGHRDLAETIDREMETAYLFDILKSERAPEVAAWANEHGFTAEELAWIQPGYPPPYTWASVGGGTDGPVHVTLELSSGDLLVAGEFTEAGSNPFNNIAIWDGTAYSALGNGLLGTITSVVEFNGDIYVGGSGFNGGMSDLARWNGTTWSYYTIFEGKWPLINTLHVHDGMLYAGGEALGFVGADHEVRRINNDFTYTTVGSRFNGRVLDLETYFGFLIAGGEFTALENDTDPLIAHIALLEGFEWGQFLEGTDASVRALLTDGTDLYIGGDLFIDIAPVFGLAKVTNMGSEIEELLPNLVNYIFPANGPTYISSLVKGPDGLYFGGSFSMGIGMEIGNNLGLFTGIDAVAPMVMVDAPVHALALQNDRLYAGGDFSAMYPYIISLDLTTSIGGPVDHMQLSVHPNPVADQVTITSSDRIENIRIIDNAGREVSAPIVRRNDGLQIDARSLAPGAYTINGTVGNKPATAKFIMQ